MKLSFLSKKNKLRNQPWQWPSFNHPKTLSFKANNITDGDKSPVSCSTNSSQSPTFSDQYENMDDELLEMTLKSLFRERLFFDLDDTRSILCEEIGVGVLFQDSVILKIESDDPYLDFRRSMEEMVEAHGLKDWEGLEELLGRYLRVNGKLNHGYIIGAYIDLLAKMISNSSSSTNDSTTTNDRKA